jgi:hypothetical protein
VKRREVITLLGGGNGSVTRAQQGRLAVIGVLQVNPNSRVIDGLRA